MKAQKETIGSESESSKQLVAKAKIEAKGAQALMNEAGKEKKNVLGNEESAAANIIAAMKGEIRKQLADARKEEAEHDKQAKTVLAKASQILVEAKAMIGDYSSVSQETKKAMKKIEDPSSLAHKSFAELKRIASEQIEEISKQMESTKRQDPSRDEDDAKSEASPEAASEPAPEADPEAAVSSESDSSDKPANDSKQPDSESDPESDSESDKP